MANIKKIKLGDTTYDICDGINKNIIILSDNSSATAGTWLAKTNQISAYADGQLFMYKIAVAGASTTTLNITGSGGSALGAKNVYRYGTTKLTTHYGVGQYILLTYNSTDDCFRVVNNYDANTTYSNVSLGQGYSTCSTAEATAAKTVSLSSYALTTGGIVVIKFTYAVPANATLNINSKGAKNIYYRGAKITAGIISAGDTAAFIYNGSYYHLFAIDKKLGSLAYQDLDSSGRIPSSILPSYVDDVVEGYLKAADSKFYKESTYATAIAGETGKIYVDLSTNKTYRWSGSAFVEISSSLALGETNSTAYRGDRGKVAYDHSQAAHAPSNAEKNQNAFSNITVESTTIAADSATDTITLVAGSDITLTPDATNDQITIAATNTKVTSVDNHYTPAADANAQLIASLSGTAGAYAKGTEYTVLTGIKAQRDAKGHVTGITYTAQKVKDTDTDTKNTTGSTNSASTLYLVGATEQSANPVTYSNSNLYTTNGNLFIKGSNPYLAFINSNKTAYFQTYNPNQDDVAANIQLGMGFGWANSLRVDQSGNVYSTGSIYEAGTALSNKYAAKDHTHDISIATSSGTNQLTLAHGTKYALTAGGKSFIFTMPSSGDTDKKAASGNTSSKIFLIGATSQSSDGQTTYSHDTAYVGTDGHLYSNSSQVVNLSDEQTITGRKYMKNLGITGQLWDKDASPGDAGQILSSTGDGIEWINNTSSDTKNTAGSTNSTSKLYLIGAASQAANPQTYSNSSVYATDGTLYATNIIADASVSILNEPVATQAWVKDLLASNATVSYAVIRQFRSEPGFPWGWKETCASGTFATNEGNKSVTVNISKPAHPSYDEKSNRYILEIYVAGTTYTLSSTRMTYTLADTTATSKKYAISFSTPSTSSNVHRMVITTPLMSATLNFKLASTTYLD